MDQLTAERDRLLALIESMKDGVEEAKRKQLEAETKFKHMEGRVDNLKARIKELEDNNKVFT